MAAANPTLNDAQLEFGSAYAYAQPGFAEFYDLMVAALPPEYEPGLDLEFFCRLAQDLARADRGERKQVGRADDKGTVTVLDLATGTGRVLQALLAVASPDWTLVGVDHSATMLEACRARLGTAPAAQVSLVQQSMQALSVAVQADLVLVSAGSFHHLVTREEQLGALRGIRERLRAPRAGRPALVVLTLLPGEEDFEPAGEAPEAEALQLAGYRWRRLEAAVERGLEPVVASSPNEGDGGDLAPVLFEKAVCTARYELQGPGGWRERQVWSLRKLGREELRALLEAAGLRLEAEFGSFAAALANTPLRPGTEELPRVVLATRS